LANQISDAAALLLQQGKITQSQFDILMQLANQGHEIAQIEGLIQNAIMASNGDLNLYNNLSIVFNGQTYTPAQLAGMIGIYSRGPQDFTTSTVLDTFSANDPHVEPELSSFISLYNQAVSSGALSDPIALSTINSASEQIASLGEVSEETSWQYGSGNTPVDSANLTTIQAQTATTMDSGNICRVGSFQDNGVLCSP